MPNKSYNRGVAFERSVIKKLEEKGYTAARTAGSHGSLDIWAMNKIYINLIQCKTTLKVPTIKMYIEDLRDISKVITPNNAIKELQIKYGRVITRIRVL